MKSPQKCMAKDKFLTPILIFLIPPKKPVFLTPTLNLFKMHKREWVHISQESSLMLWTETKEIQYSYLYMSTSKKKSLKEGAVTSVNHFRYFFKNNNPVFEVLYWEQPSESSQMISTIILYTKLCAFVCAYRWVFLGRESFVFVRLFKEPVSSR